MCLTILLALFFAGWNILPAQDDSCKKKNGSDVLNCNQKIVPIRDYNLGCEEFDGSDKLGKRWFKCWKRYCGCCNALTGPDCSSMQPPTGWLYYCMDPDLNANGNYWFEADCACVAGGASPESCCMYCPELPGQND
jgi:hypothetical protein